MTNETLSDKILTLEDLKKVPKINYNLKFVFENEIRQTLKEVVDGIKRHLKFNYKSKDFNHGLLFALNYIESKFVDKLMGDKT